MLFSAFVLGLLGSFHCIGMCGPIAFMLPVDRGNSIKKGTQIGLYHFGRLLAYGVIGVVFGILGKGFYAFGFQQQLSVVVGILMILFVVIPQQTLNRFHFSKPIYKVISKIKWALGNALKKKSNDAFLTIGFLNGFLPCGLVYMAIFASVAVGNALNGALYMAVFGLGTIPLMTATIYFSDLIKGRMRQKIQKVIPVFVVIIGVLFILRGLGLGIPFISPAPVFDTVTNTVDCH